MNHLGVSVSPNSITKTLECVGEGFDMKREAWKSKIISHLKEEVESTSKLEQLNKEKKALQQQLCSNELGNDNRKLTKEFEIVCNDCSKEAEKLMSLRDGHPPMYCAVIDNFDLRIEAADMTSDSQTKDIHWCNHNVILDRVSALESPNDKPTAAILDVPNATFVPNVSDNCKLIKDFTVLVSRVFVEHFPQFKDAFRDIVPQHIQHKYSSEMKKKSQKESMGIIFKNENKGEDMIDISRYLQDLVPSVGEEMKEKFRRMPVVGDQLTIERGIEAKFSVSNAYTPRRRLEGIYYQVADWHHENKFLDVSRVTFYGFNSLFQMKLFSID